MSSEANIYCRNIAPQPEQNRRALLLVLLSKLVLVLLLGVIYAGVRFMG